MGRRKKPEQPRPEPLLGAEVRQIREDLELSLAELGMRLGVGKGTVWSWEVGERQTPRILRPALRWVWYVEKQSQPPF